VTVKGGEVKNAPPPDTQGVWPLIRGKLNVKKVPPYPPKRTLREDSGSSLAMRLHRSPNKGIDKRFRRNEKRKLDAVGKATIG
jgi:hypothetical protein